VIIILENNHLVIHQTTMEELTLVLISIFSSCFAFYLVISSLVSKSSCFNHTSRVLLVTAHPDDEVMFFGPTILSLLRSQCQVFLLVLSPGREPGHTRKRELYASCEMLGVPSSNIVIVRHSKLRDDPGVRWREELVSNIVTRHVSSLDIDTVITFDRQGVSGHRNHIALYYGVLCSAVENTQTTVLSLSSVNILRKYSSVLDVPMSFLLCPTVFVSSVGQWWRIQRAMMSHRSQYTWFRKLYMIFSRYTLINTLEVSGKPRNSVNSNK